MHGGDATELAVDAIKNDKSQSQQSEYRVDGRGERVRGRGEWRGMEGNG